MSNNKFKDGVIEYFKKHYEQHKMVPPTRQVFKHFSKAKFYQTFPNGVAEVCKLARIPVPEAGIKRTQQALRTRKKKRAAEATKQANKQTTYEELKQSIKKQKEEQAFMIQKAKDHAKATRLLALNPNPEIRRPILEAEAEILPEILKVNYGITATLPEMIALKKAYDKAKEEEWDANAVWEWGALAEEEQASFKQLCEVAREKDLLVMDYIYTLTQEGEEKKKKIEQLSGEIRNLERKKVKVNWDCELLKTQCNNLEGHHKEREKQLEDKYREDAKAYEIDLLKYKRQREKEKEECKHWETKRDNLEKQTNNLVKDALEKHDRIIAEKTTAKKELEQLRSFVGPEGTVTDLVKQKQNLKATLTEKDQQLVEKALWLSRDFNARIEAERTVTEERENTLLLAEHLIEKAGALPHLFLFLSNPQHFPKEHFKELNSLMDELQVWRGYENPPSLYKDILSKSKAPLKHIKADIEKYME